MQVRFMLMHVIENWPTQKKKQKKWNRIASHSIRRNKKNSLFNSSIINSFYEFLTSTCNVIAIFCWGKWFSITRQTKNREKVEIKREIFLLKLWTSTQWTVTIGFGREFDEKSTWNRFSRQANDFFFNLSIEFIQSDLILAIICFQAPPKKTTEKITSISFASLFHFFKWFFFSMTEKASSWY